MVKEVEKHEKAQLEKFLKETECPSDILKELERGADQRAYIKDCMLTTSEAGTGVAAVATNYVYRHMTASMSDLFPRDPTFDLRPRDKRWGENGPGREVYGFADTVEKLMNFKAGRNFTEFARASAREALTVASSWGKLIWHEDYKRDPVGVKHSKEMDRTVAVYTHLHRKYKKKEFDDESEEYAQLLSLSDTLKELVMDELDKTMEAKPVDPGLADMDPRVIEANRIAPKKLLSIDDLPPVPLFQEFIFEVVEQEDIRWDRRINRYENWMDLDWIAHRVRMTSEEICIKFGVDSDKIQVKTTEPAPDEDTQAHREDIEENRSSDTINVWERWDRLTGKVYVFCKEVDEFLDEYVPVTWSGFHMIMPLEFNPVSGELLGISDVDMQRALQDEINERRTNEREYMSSTLPRYLVAADAFAPGDLAAVEGSRPFQFIPLQTTENPNSKIFPWQAKEVSRDWFNTSGPVAELGVMAARPTSAIGGANPSVTATQTAYSSEQLGSQTSQRRAVFEDYLTLFGRAMIEILLQNMDAMEVRAIVGPDSVWPDSRLVALTDLDLEVTTNLDNEPNSDRFMERFIQLQQAALGMGLMPNGKKILPRLSREVLKMDIPVEEWFPVPVQPDANASTGAAPGPTPGSPGHEQANTPRPEQLPGAAQVAMASAQ